MFRQRVTVVVVTILSALGFCIGIVAHIAAIKGRSLVGDAVGPVLTFGGPLILIVADLALDNFDREKSSRGRWDGIFRATPRWSRWIFGVVVLYWIGGFAYSYFIGPGTVSWNAMSGEHATPQVIRTFSRWWILIYGGSLLAMLGAWGHYQKLEAG